MHRRVRVGEGWAFHRVALQVAALAFALAPGPGRADEAAPPAKSSEPSKERTAAEAVRQSNDPVPTVVQYTFQALYAFPKNGSYTAQILFQPIIPYAGFFIPDLHVDGFRSVARVQLYAENQQTGRTVASGLTDLGLVDAVVHPAGPFELGVGFGTVFPMATNPLLGQGKWQLGPAAIAALDSIPHLQLALLGQFLWSVAGESQRPALASAVVQPLIAVHLPGDLSLFTNWQMTFSVRGAQTIVPVNLGISRGFSGHFVGQLQSVYTLAGEGKDQIAGVVTLNFQP
jgi:hypothetical protein